MTAGACPGLACPEPVESVDRWPKARSRGRRRETCVCSAATNFLRRNSARTSALTPYGSGLRTGSVDCDYATDCYREPSPSTPSATPRGTVYDVGGPHAARAARAARPRSPRRRPRSSSSSKRCSRSARSRSAAPTTPSGHLTPARARRRRLDGQRRQRRAGRRAGGAQGRRRLQRHGDGHGARDASCAPSSGSAPTIVQAPYDECWRTVEAHASDRMQGHFVHPFDDDAFISGNGTVGLEIVEDLPDVDAVIAPLGGGGLLAGIGVRARARCGPRRASTPRSRKPRRRCAARSTPAKASRFDDWQPSFVDGAGGTSVLRRCGRCCRPGWHDSLVVSLDDAARAMRLVADRVARHRGRRGGVRRRRGALARHSPRAATGRSSRSCPAATSISRASPRSSARATDDSPDGPDPP